MRTFNTELTFLLVLLFAAVMLTAVPVSAQRGGRDRDSGNTGSPSKDSSYSPWSRTPSSPRPSYTPQQTYTRPSDSDSSGRLSPQVFQRPSTTPRQSYPVPSVNQPKSAPAAQPIQLPQQTQKPIIVDRQRPVFEELPKPDFKPESRPDRLRPDFKPENRPDRPRPDFEPENRPDRPRPDFKPESRPDRPRPDFKPESRPDRPRPDFKPESRPDRPGRPPITENRPDRYPDRRPDYRPDYRPPRPVGPPPGIIDYYRRSFTGYHSYWTPDWYHRHPSLWNPVWIPHRNWWLCPSWDYTWGWYGSGFFTGVVVGNTLYPYYYNYGSNIIYRGDMVYVNGVPYVSAAEYYRQALELANTSTLVIQKEPVIVEKEVPVLVEKVVEKEVPAVIEKNKEEFKPQPAVNADIANGEWLPMGTFAFSDDAADSRTIQDKNRIIQLASDKKGRIRGNYIDENKNETRQLKGAVDPKTQRVAMMFADDDKTVMECGLWNLTQDSVPLLVHKGEDKMENVTLIRLTPPEEEENPAEPKAPAADTEEELAP